MKFVADFHIHSKYSRATSPKMDLEHLDKWADIKGIKVLGTGDFTHPEWFKNLKEKLDPAEEGLYKLKKTAKLPNSQNETRFILTSEISCIYSKGGKVRKIHLIVFAPSLEIVGKINAYLGNIGNLKADGRPILGLDAKELLKIVLNISPECLVVCAHAWTPWFSIFGSRSGFNSIEECFEEYSKYIYAIETGLSSDPAMNWRLSSLDKITLMSNSDAHSPEKIGRESNVFDMEISYPAIFNAIKNKDPKKFIYTVEFFPEEGKYHYDGHRLCGISFKPAETKKYHGICPRCGKPLTVGVLSRVEELADRPAFDKSSAGKPEGAIPFKSLIPLSEIIIDALEKKSKTKQSDFEYQNLIKKFGNEFNVLLNVSSEELKNNTLPEIAEGVIRAREGKVSIAAGYDGVYGKIKIFGDNEKKNSVKQKVLF